MAWEFPNAPAGSAYPRPDPNVLGNALANLVSSYQGAQQGEQQTEANQKRLDLLKVFSGGVPMKDGVPDMAAVMQARAKAGDPNAPESLFPTIQQQQWQQSTKLSPAFGGAGDISQGGDVNTLASNIASRIETKGQANPYGALGPVTPSGDRAYGKYQVMGNNVPSWTKEVLGVEMTPEQFLSSPDAQEKVAHAKLGEYIKETGSPQDAASMWFTGKPLAEGANRADQSGMTGARYAAIATEGMTPRGGGMQVASLGPTAYADPNAPRIPPGSASAPDLPSAFATPTSAVRPPPSSSGGVTNLGTVPDSAMPKPTGPASGPAPTAPNTASGIVASAVQDPQGAARLTKLITGVLGVPPNAPLTPEQAAKAKLIVQNAARSLQPPAGGQGQQQSAQGQPLVPQFPLPYGLKPGQEMQAVMRLNREIADIAIKGNPYQQRQIPEMEFIRDGILKQMTPMEERPGTTLLDPRTAEVIYQAPMLGAGNIAMQRFIEQNPYATAEQIQAFAQSGRSSRSAASAYINRYLQENPNATAEDVAKAAQDYTKQSSALTRFTSGTQGNTIRSFNVLVDHFGVLNDAIGALKNGNMRLFNQAAQEIAVQTGSPAPTNFDSIKSIVGDELVKAIVGGVATIGDREEVKNNINRAESPEQLAGAIESYRRLAIGQLRGLQKQYEESTGRTDFSDMLSPGTRQFFEGHGSSPAGGGTSGSDVLPDGWSVTAEPKR